MNKRKTVTRAMQRTVQAASRFALHPPQPAMSTVLIAVVLATCSAIVLAYQQQPVSPQASQPLPRPPRQLLPPSLSVKLPDPTPEKPVSPPQPVPEPSASSPAPAPVEQQPAPVTEPTPPAVTPEPPAPPASPPSPLQNLQKGLTDTTCAVFALLKLPCKQ